MKQKDLIVLSKVTHMFDRRNYHNSGTQGKTRVNVNLRRYQIEYRKVLEDVNLRFSEGEIISLIGANGSGKSTLLKIIAGVIKPTTGTVVVSQRVSPIVSIGLGLNPQLTCLENLEFMAALMVKSRRQYLEMVDEVFDWTELSDYKNEPLKVLSSGMRARLAFAISAYNMDSVILIDEALSVGDKRFVEKSKEKILENIKKGALSVIATHDLSFVENFTSRAILLDQGKVLMDGCPKSAVQKYCRQ